MSQTRFSASFAQNASQPTLEYTLYNPCRDREISGIVVTIQQKGDAGQSAAFDLFINAMCDPLGCASNQRYVPVLKRIDGDAPTVVLKEIHYVPLLKSPN